MKIDELVLSLVLDVAGLKKGQAATEAALASIRAESEKTDESMRAGAKKTAEAQRKHGEAIVKNSKATEQADKKAQDGARNNAHNYGKWLASILSIGAAMVALNKFKNFAIDLTNSDAAAGRMAENIGMLTQDLTAFGNTADKLGGSAGEMTSDLFNMSQAIVGLRAGGELPDWLTDPKGFFKLGGDMLPQLLDDSVSMLDKARMIQERMSKVSAPIAQYAGRKLGMSVGTITAFHNADWQKHLDLQYKLNAANESDAKLAQQRVIAWKRVQDRYESLGRVIVTRLSPLFLKLTNDFVSFLSKKENVEAFTRVINSFVSAIEHIDGKSLVQIFKDIGEIVSAVGGVIAVAAKGISQIVDLSMGGTAVDRGFLGNMANILDGMVRSIKFIISGYKQIGELVKAGAEEAAEAQVGRPTALNAYNPNGKDRTALQATEDVLHGIWVNLLTSLLSVNHMVGEAMTTLPAAAVGSTTAGRAGAVLGWGLAGTTRGYAAGMRMPAAPSAGQRVGAQGNGAVTMINSNNTTTTATVTVKSPEQAGRAVRSLNPTNPYAASNGQQ